MSGFGFVAGLVNRVGHSLDVFEDLTQRDAFKYHHVCFWIECDMNYVFVIVLCSYCNANTLSETVNNPMLVATDISVITPSRQGARFLVSKLSFIAKQGQSVCIVGPSGCGKSSILRVLASLWPFQEGSLIKPAGVGKQGVFFLPQRPYISEGSLRAQILYPLSEHVVQETPQELAHIKNLLRIVGIVYSTFYLRCFFQQNKSCTRTIYIFDLFADLEYLLEWGLNSLAPWADILSTGLPIVFLVEFVKAVGSILNFEIPLYFLL